MHDSGAHLGLGLGLRVRARVEVLRASGFGPHTAAAHGLGLRRSLQLLTAYRLGAGEAGGRELGEEGVQRGVRLGERGRVGEDHRAPGRRSSGK